MSVYGPISPDTAFLDFKKKGFDIFIGMYHDQVLAPYKAIFKYNAINIKINHSGGYKAGDHRKDGVNVFPIKKEIAVGKVFHFGNGITFKSSKTVKVDSQTIYGFVEGGDLKDNTVGASGGLHIVTDPRFKHTSFVKLFFEPKYFVSS